MPSQLLAIVWIVSTGEQFGEKIYSFSKFEQNYNFQEYLLSIVWIVSTVKKLVKSSIIFKTWKILIFFFNSTTQAKTGKGTPYYKVSMNCGLAAEIFWPVFPITQINNVDNDTEYSYVFFSCYGMAERKNDAWILRLPILI